MLEHDGIDLKDPAVGMEFPRSFAPEVRFVRVSCHERTQSVKTEKVNECGSQRIQVREFPM
ncbi:MAG TPA: hypothetical protein PKX94_10910, partial [Opitutales bacterium]|nr:hypothetical protein [Opitutales bacterium]